MGGEVEELLRAVVEPLARRMGTNRVQRAMGFWVLWHTYGSMEGMLYDLRMPQSSIYQQLRDFRAVTGVGVEDFMPRVALALRAENSDRLEAEQAAEQTEVERLAEELPL